MKKLLFLLMVMAVFAASGQTILTQSTDPDIFPGSLAACNTSGPGTIEDNHFMRIFDTDNYNVQDTVFFLHIEMAVDNTSGGPYNLVGRVHEIEGAALFSNMTLLATDTAAVFADSGVYKMIIPFKNGYALPGDSIVAEVFAAQNGLIVFNPGTNPYPETGPSLLVAPACGLTEPTAYSSIGFANIKLLLNLWVNHKPVLNDITTSVFKDNVLNFAKADFDAAFTDHDADTVEMLRILALPVNGTVENNGVPVVVGDTVYCNEIDLLTYTPEAGFFGADSFKVAARDNSHWSNDSATIAITVLNWQVSVEENTSQKIELYPNPANDFVYLRSTEKIEALYLYSATGAVLDRPSVSDAAIDLSALPGGVYFIAIRCGDTWTVEQIVKN